MEDQLHLPGSGDINFAFAYTSTLPPQTALAPPFPVTETHKNSSYHMGSDTIKARIMSHPLYPALLRAFIDCRKYAKNLLPKVGAPPEVVGRLSSLADKLESNSDDTQEEEQPADPDLDQFMETYCDALMTYSQELTRQIQEANEFFGGIVAHIDSFTLDGTVCESGGSSKDVQETGDVTGLPITSPYGEGKELTNQILDKHSGYLRSLWRELSGKKKNGRLPRDARQKLLRWWELHHMWPYPSEMEKHSLAESTGLHMKQINHWFINQRKRHWTPMPQAVGVGSRVGTLEHINSSPRSGLQTFR